jgi:hypothetical protein
LQATSSFSAHLRGSSQQSAGNAVSMSGSRSSAARSVADSDGDENGVWVPGELDAGRGNFATARQAGAQISTGASRFRAQSVVSDSTTDTTMSSNTETSTTWGNFNPPDKSGYRVASGVSQGTNSGFVSLRAVRQDPVTRVMSQMQREERQRREEAEQRMRRADSDDEDDEEWEL